VVGTDISQGMVEEARAAHPGIEFRRLAAENLDYSGEFDVVFCNSALQWFSDAGKAVRAMRRALRSPGRLGIACPATFQFAPFFGRMVMAAVRRPELARVFAHWRSPWFQLGTVEEYRAFFEESGLATRLIRLDHEVDRLTVDDAFDVYMIGAAQGFATAEYYEVEIDDGYVGALNAAVREAMESEASGGEVTVDFNRLYYVGTV
jgi:SAM-dependent methyltransferase